MVLFTGTYAHKVDAKGRVSLPADFRDSLSAGSDGAKGFYLFPSRHAKCLEACDYNYMERIAEKIEEQFALFSQEESVLSDISAEARWTLLDGTGRFVLLGDFSSYALVGQQALFVGRGRRFQVWSREQHEHHRAMLADVAIPPLHLGRGRV